MKTIDLEKLIQAHDLDPNKIAKELFPKNKYARLALNRVIKGEANLDSDQISKLAMLLNVPIGQLFSGEEWKSTYSKNVHILTNGHYRAELDTVSWTTKIYDNDSLFHEEVLHSGAMGLTEYLNMIQSIIIKHEQK